MQNQSLQAEIASLRQQIKDLLGGNKAEIDGYITQIKVYEEKISLYISEINTYKQQNIMLQGEIDNLKRPVKPVDSGHGLEIANYRD